MHKIVFTFNPFFEIWFYLFSETLLPLVVKLSNKNQTNITKHQLY